MFGKVGDDLSRCRARMVKALSGVDSSIRQLLDEPGHSLHPHENERGMARETVQHVTDQPAWWVGSSRYRGRECRAGGLWRAGPAAVEKESTDNRYLRDHLYIMQVCDLWNFFGDRQFAEAMFDSCTRAFEYMYKFKDLDRDGLVEAAAALDDVDLGEGVDRTSANAVEKSVDQTLLFGALIKYAAMAEALGRRQSAVVARAG